MHRDHCCRGRSKPGCRIVGLHTRWQLTPEPTSSYASIDFWCQLVASQSSHSGFLDVSRSSGGLRISGWIGQLSCFSIFSTSLSVAAILRRAGSSMLKNTGTGITQVKHTADCFGGAWLKSPLSTEVWHLHHIWRDCTPVRWSIEVVAEVLSKISATANNVKERVTGNITRKADILRVQPSGSESRGRLTECSR